ncbi:MAG: Fe-S cluster assembly protein SufD [Parachlamydiaceae bacterium]|nr:Fe-S cluster assembly protein SufD [Parachlamydiaceae bacterium]
MIAEPGLEHETFKTFIEKFRKETSHTDATSKMRQRAWDHFITLGLPSKKMEAYRYIKLKQLFSQFYQGSRLPEVDSQEIASYILPESKRSFLVFVNGHYVPSLSNREAIPSNVVISTFQEASQTYGTFLNNQWTRSLKEEQDSFAALNGAIHQNGLFLYVPPKCIVDVPVQIIHLTLGNNPWQMMTPRLQISVGAQSEINFVMSQKDKGGQGYFVNHVTEISLEEAARVHFTQIFCDLHPEGWYFDAFRANLKRDSHLKTVCVTEGSATVRTDYRISLIGENAEALLNGVCMLADKREAHSHIFMDHQAPNCRSYQLFKGVLNDFARSSFEGKIMVRQIAQKTEAFQLNNHLILNDHAHADSKPNLEIFADDVKASHGATVGQLNADQLFYMKTRGFSDHEARNLLIYGFCEEVIEQIPVDSLKDEISLKAKNILRKRE